MSVLRGKTVAEALQAFSQLNLTANTITLFAFALKTDSRLYFMPEEIA